MVVSSKLASPPLNLVHCGHIIHTLAEHSCTQALLWNLYRNHMSAGKYYLPLLLFPFVLNIRKQTKSRLLAIFKNYFQVTTFAATINALTFYWMCILRRVNGRFLLISPFLSTYVACQLCWWTPPKSLQFYITGVSQAAIESLLRQLNVRLVHSRATQTLIFMLCSLIVLSQQQAQRFAGFWFIKPALLPADYKQMSYQQRLKQGIIELRNYLAIGLALDALNAVQRKKFNKLELGSTSFMLSYIGIYKLTQCLLIDRLEPKQTNLIAAFLSGAAFGTLHRLPLTFMTFAVVIASQVLWQQFCDLNNANSKLYVLLQRMPWAKLILPINVAYLVHSYFFQTAVVSALAKTFINATCDNNAKRVLDHIELPVEATLERVQKLPIRGFLF